VVWGTMTGCPVGQPPGAQPWTGGQSTVGGQAGMAGAGHALGLAPKQHHPRWSHFHWSMAWVTAHPLAPMSAAATIAPNNRPFMASFLLTQGNGDSSRQPYTTLGEVQMQRPASREFTGSPLTLTVCFCRLPVILGPPARRRPGRRRIAGSNPSEGRIECAESSATWVGRMRLGSC
jgi:hypothetical protein